MSDIDLKPCPCCGGKAVMFGDEYPYVECTICHISFCENHMYNGDAEEAAVMWNSRVSPEEDELYQENIALRETLRLKELECEA